MSDPARYGVDVDPRRGIVRITLSGFFRPEDVAAFAVLRAERQALLNDRPHVTVADIRGMAILSQDVVGIFAQRLGNPPHRASRLAFVVAPSLTRFQLQRAATGRDIRCFATPAEAEDWALGDDRAAAA